MEHARPMDTKAELNRIFQEDANAVDLFMGVLAVSDVWDDLIDGTRAVTHEQINDAFLQALVVLPSNPHFVRFGPQLRGAMTGAVLAWMDSDALRLQPANPDDLLAAHVLRYQIVDIALVLLVELFGWRYAHENAVTLRRLFRRESFKQFMES